MEAKHLYVIGLIGGLIAMVGVFTEWASASAFGMSVSETGWGMTEGTNAPYVALAGGVLTALGVLAALGDRKPISYLMPLGGILAAIGGVWGYSKVSDAIGGAAASAADVSVGYGIYLCIIGGVLGLVGAYGMKQ